MKTFQKNIRNITPSEMNTTGFMAQGQLQAPFQGVKVFHKFLLFLSVSLFPLQEGLPLPSFPPFIFLTF